MKKEFILKPYREYDIRLSTGVVIRICSFNPNNDSPVTPLKMSLAIEERRAMTAEAMDG